MTSHDLHALQLPNGGFASTVTSRQGREIDCNGFTAAIVLRLTRHVPDDALMTIVRGRALDFVTTCSSSIVPDAFGFWPDTARPAWAHGVPADVDDTAIMLTELLRHGRVTRDDALRRFCRAVMSQRVSETAAVMLPTWVVPGSFYTWIADAAPGARRGANTVDACVNANVVALMARLAAAHLPGYEAAVATVESAVRWAADDKRRLSAITPFYPSVTSLIDAVEHAVESGARELGETRDCLRALNLDPHDEDAGCCRGAYGPTVWHCSAIDVARVLARAAARRPAHTIPALEVAAG